ncbi:hypothetical protein INT43_003151 [Umbelopsis isabellina]|uniref:Uncharacterized protein n=1 Tax=Mortierella isabellina TaxID=91625 RepID=A0A8H7PQY4_MORIS|nr:hypothetical protein INT43_003151 [Umbelopsis isabellina]
MSAAAWQNNITSYIRISEIAPQKACIIDLYTSQPLRQQKPSTLLILHTTNSTGGGCKDKQTFPSFAGFRAVA